MVNLQCVAYINPFQTSAPFLFPLKTLENSSFLIFSKGTKMPYVASVQNFANVIHVEGTFRQ